jgi:hypothetical protein
LTEKERQEFDYLTDIDNADFVRYQDVVYGLDEFMRVEDGEGPLAGWDGYKSESYFSGVLIKYAGDDFDGVIVGRYCV